MNFIDIMIVAFGLSMDAFAVSLCKGLAAKKVKHGEVLACGLYFGGFQAFMPVLGYFLGIYFVGVVDHLGALIAFVVLSFLGTNMIKEAKGGEGISARFDRKAMFPLAVATSIDALAVGMTLAFLKVELLSAVSVIGITTLVCSMVGVKLGHLFGAKLKGKAMILGGGMLILIGMKMLVEHFL